MMTRREMLQLLLSGAVIGPAAVKSILAAPAVAEAAPILTGQIGMWQNVQWWTAMFDWGAHLGVAVGVTDPRTGRLYRNAVRIMADDNMRKWYEASCDHFRYYEKYEKANAALEPAILAPPGIQAAKALLSMWAEEKAYIIGLASPPRTMRYLRGANTKSTHGNSSTACP